MKHTPGPWKVNNVFLDNAPNRFIVSQGKWGGRNVADCGESGQGDWDINEANARLIAAAPELLEALRVALCNMEVAKNKPPGYTPRKVEDMLERTINHARAAIAQAEGGAE